MKNQIAEVGMLIRKPIEQVYEAFIDPRITTKFWFTKSTGRLDENKEVQWTWEMYDITVAVTVKSLIPNKKIIIGWDIYKSETTIEWTFTPLDESRTYVKIINEGFQGTTDEIISKVKDSIGGFTTVLDGLKAYLEHNLELNLILDKYPKELVVH